MTLEDILPNVTSIQPIEMSSAVSDLPEFSHTLDTTLTNSSSGSSPPQRSPTDDTSNKDSETLSASISTANSDTNQNKCNCLRSCIIRLTKLSNIERDQWLSGSSHSTNTSAETEGNSSNVSDSRYNMHARPPSTESSTRSTGRKQAAVNYKEHGTQDSGYDSDYEVTPKPPQPLDNKIYPSASRMTTQHMIENNKANK